MKPLTSSSAALAARIALFLAAGSLMAQTNVSNAEAWLAAAPVAPEFSVPKTKATWEKRRPEVRATLWQLLGKLPPRPKVPKVTTLVREDRGDYIFEKFTFDNGAGATVPGYVFLPFGNYTPEQINRPRRSLLPKGVGFLIGDVDKVARPPLRYASPSPGTPQTVPRERRWGESG